MQSPHLAKPSRLPGPDLQTGSQTDLPLGWKQYSSRSRGLSFRYPAVWTAVRQAHYLFLSRSPCDTPCGSGDDPIQRQLVIDLTPIHIYPYPDLKDYLETTLKRAVLGIDTEIRALPGGFLSGRVTRCGSAGREFFLFYVGRGNLVYTLTASGREQLTTAEEIISTLRFR
jgi:hypothetical protein